ncbi:MAG: hypothetical protein M3680_05325 [Myxococcota bacterium]|nr:hypothetical protein [Myxococcota bacterium]
MTATVRVKFTIAPDGKVPEAVATGGGPELDPCVARVFLQLVFPASSAAAIVVYPLTFTPAG